MTPAKYFTTLRELANKLATGSAAHPVLNKLATLLSARKIMDEQMSEYASLRDELAICLQSDGSITQRVELALYHYWCQAMRALKIDLFFIGQQQNLSLFAPFIDKTSVNKCYFTPIAADGKVDLAALRVGLGKSKLPFIIYDAHGASVLDAASRHAILGKASLFELMYWLNLPLAAEDSIVAHVLSDGAERLRQPDVNHVVLGNSYGLYAFPASKLRRAVNLATHSLSLTQIDQLVNWLLRTHPQIAHFIVCGGHFDPWYTLERNKDDYNQQILRAWSLFASHHRLSDFQPGQQRCLPRSDAQLLAEVALFHTNTAHHLQLFAQLGSDVRRRDALQATAAQVEDAGSMEAISQHELALLRGQRHSKSLRYRQTLEQNRLLLSALAARLEQADKQITWIIPPYPAAYSAALASEMKQENRGLLESVASERFHVWDFSEAHDFDRTHFRDGDHLNFSGAQRLLAQLLARGMTL